MSGHKYSPHSNNSFGFDDNVRNIQNSMHSSLIQNNQSNKINTMTLQNNSSNFSFATGQYFPNQNPMISCQQYYNPYSQSIYTPFPNSYNSFPQSQHYHLPNLFVNNQTPQWILDPKNTPQWLKEQSDVQSSTQKNNFKKADANMRMEVLDASPQFNLKSMKIALLKKFQNKVILLKITLRKPMIIKVIQFFLSRN